MRNISKQSYGSQLSLEIKILMKKREMGQKCAESIYAELRILDKLSLETKKKYEKEGGGSNMCGMYFD